MVSYNKMGPILRTMRNYKPLSYSSPAQNIFFKGLARLPLAYRCF
jgi:hypothetical protein